MSIDKRLLEILVCPVTKVQVKLLSPDRLSTLNRVVEDGGVKFSDGSVVQGPLEAALITSDSKTIYRVEAGIPVLLEDEAIVAAQVPGW